MDNKSNVLNVKLFCDSINVARSLAKLWTTVIINYVNENKIASGRSYVLEKRRCRLATGCDCGNVNHLNSSNEQDVKFRQSSQVAREIVIQSLKSTALRWSFMQRPCDERRLDYFGKCLMAPYGPELIKWHHRISTVKLTVSPCDEASVA